MNLYLAIALNVVADVVLLGLVAHVMSRPKQLAPHVAEADNLVVLPVAVDDEQIAA